MSCCWCFPFQPFQRAGTVVGAAYEPFAYSGCKFPDNHNDRHGVVDVAALHGERHIVGRLAVHIHQCGVRHGLTSVDVASTFTPTGFVVIILLIQIGGLGVMTLTSFFAMFFMGNTSLYNQLVVRDMVSSNSLNSLLSTLVYILAFTLVIEGIGMLAIWGDIHGTMGMDLQEELAFSAFHAISAFCNAGFSTLPGNLGNPLVMTGHNPFFIYISLLIILGVSVSPYW